MAATYANEFDATLGLGDDEEEKEAPSSRQATGESVAPPVQTPQRQSPLFPHVVRDPDTGDRYRVYAPSGVSPSEVMRLASEQIARMGNEKASGPRAELIPTPGQGQGQAPQGEQLTGAQRVVRQSAAPIVGGTLGAVAGAAAAPFTAGVINPWTGAMLGAAAGEAFNQYAPGWNEFTQSPKDAAAIVGAGIVGAVPGVGRVVSRAAGPVAQAGANLMGKIPGYVGPGAGVLLDLAGILGGGLGTLGGLATQHAPALLAKALTSAGGRAALNAVASQQGQAVGQAIVQGGRTTVLGTTTTELERQRALVRQGRSR